jgi:hypothetical protein
MNWLRNKPRSIDALSEEGFHRGRSTDGIHLEVRARPVHQALDSAHVARAGRRHAAPSPSLLTANVLPRVPGRTPMLSFSLGDGPMIGVELSLLKRISMISASIGDLLMLRTMF